MSGAHFQRRFQHAAFEIAKNQRLPPNFEGEAAFLPSTAINGRKIGVPAALQSCFRLRCTDPKRRYGREGSGAGAPAASERSRIVRALRREAAPTGGFLPRPAARQIPTWRNNLKKSWVEAFSVRHSSRRQPRRVRHPGETPRRLRTPFRSGSTVNRRRGSPRCCTFRPKNNF